MELVPPKLKSKKKKKNTGQELENFTIDTFRELTEERKLFDERFEKVLLFLHEIFLPNSHFKNRFLKNMKEA